MCSVNAFKWRHVSYAVSWYSKTLVVCRWWSLNGVARVQRGVAHAMRRVAAQ